jgi:hypothetical protein
MTDPANATESHDAGFLAPKPGAQPVAHCFRCGKETPAGQGLCKKHNPHRINGPSSTQMHATVFGGIALGVLALFILARLAVGATGPYVSEVTVSAAGPGGGAAVSFAVTNEGDSDGVADCRVTRDGIPRPDDLAFRSDTVPAGETVVYERQLDPPPVASVSYDPESLSVVCT